MDQVKSGDEKLWAQMDTLLLIASIFNAYMISINVCVIHNKVIHKQRKLYSVRYSVWSLDNKRVTGLN
jgi:hypothetical protein